MKNFKALISILFISLSSCSVDEFAPCEDAPGMEGLLCKEFRFENNESIGYLAYFYNSDKQLTRKEYKSIEGQLKKFETYEYVNALLVNERSFDEEAKLLREKKYFYNAVGKPAAVLYIENGEEVASTTYEYSDTLLLKESNFIAGLLDNYKIYTYYTGETDLYRTSLYSAAGELLSYTNIGYFVNNYQRHDHYSGTHVFTGYDLYQYDDAGNILRFSVYNSSAGLISYIEYTYNQNAQLDTSREYDEESKLLKHTKFIYH